MKSRLLVAFLLLSSLFYAQDKKWNIEASYPISVGDQFSNDKPGTIDLGLKYRFVSTAWADFGVGLNTAFYFEKGTMDSFPVQNFKETTTFVMPRIFAELKLPTLPRLHPMVGLGYAIVRTRTENNAVFTDSGIRRNFDLMEDEGLFLTIGLNYDLSNSLFLLAHYDYLLLQDTADGDIRYGMLKLGLGFRF